MKRTTIMLPPDLHDRALRFAHQRGISLGELIRQSIRACLDGGGESRAEDPLFADVALFDGPAPADLAVHHDRYLDETGT